MSRELFSQLAFEARRFRDLVERGLELIDHRAQLISIRNKARACGDPTTARLAELELEKTEHQARNLDQEIRALSYLMQRHTKHVSPTTEKDSSHVVKH